MLPDSPVWQTLLDRARAAEAPSARVGVFVAMPGTRRRAAKRCGSIWPANDESGIGEVVRQRLFEDLGNVRIRKKTARACAD